MAASWASLVMLAAIFDHRSFGFNELFPEPS